jgi:hypothetical protein
LATHEIKSPEMDFEWFWTGFLGLSNEFPYYSSQLTWARTSRRQAWGKPGQGLMEIHGFPLRKWSRNSGKGSITNYRYDTIYIYVNIIEYYILYIIYYILYIINNYIYYIIWGMVGIELDGDFFWAPKLDRRPADAGVGERPGPEIRRLWIDRSKRI